MTEREQRLIKLAEEEIEMNRELVESDPYRLHFHLMPPVGLLNDPNGFIQWNGTYHMFYQWMPFKTGHGEKYWGHYSSMDLVEWRHEPIALAPSESFEKNGCYSGSAVEHEGEMVLFYTGNVKDEEGNRETYQCMAISGDGVTFEKKGPVVKLPEDYTPHFRDPKVWKHERYWYMAAGAQSHDLQGKVALLRSADLTSWEHLGAIAGSHMNGLGDFGYMWECPDLFDLGGNDILIVSPQGLEPNGYLYHNKFQAGYFVGELDYEKVVYTHGEFVELDRGFEFYAPQTTLDESGRRLLVGWMGVPEQDEDKHPTIAYKWVHALTLPRELKWEDGRLLQVPVKELELLRSGECVHQGVQLSDKPVQLDGVEGTGIELELNFVEAGLEGKFEIDLYHHAKITYDPSKKEFSFGRQSFVDGEWEKRSCILQSLRELHVYVDTSSVELFVNGGEEVFTSRIFPEVDDCSISFRSAEKAVMNLIKWKL